MSQVERDIERVIDQYWRDAKAITALIGMWSAVSVAHKLGEGVKAGKYEERMVPRVGARPPYRAPYNMKREYRRRPC